VGRIEVGRPVARDAPSQIPACGFPAPGSSRMLAYHSCLLVEGKP